MSSVEFGDPRLPLRFWEKVQVDPSGCWIWTSTKYRSEPVTARVNMLRGEGPTGKKARQTHCSNGHAFTPDNTYVTRSRRRCRICTAEFQKRYRVGGDLYRYRVRPSRAKVRANPLVTAPEKPE
jgi:sugar lactone lactonase YvrE